MKQLIIVFFAVGMSVTGLSQDLHDKHLMQRDTTLWKQENFTLPTGFAQEMTVQGFEEALFPEGWSDPESPEMWSYVFTWSVATEKMLSTQVLEENLELYFDGLMGVSTDSIVLPKLPTNAMLLKKTIGVSKNTFSGKVRTFDRFRSNKMMTLHVLVEQEMCTHQGKALIVFRFSPKGFDHKVWKKLTSLTLAQNACEQ